MSPLKPYSKDLQWLALLFGVFFAFMLGSRPLTPPDEGRYVEIPREMVQTGDFITPRLNGVKYFEKPPLVYWAQAATMTVFGENEWGWRIWNATMALVSVLGTYVFGRAMFGRKSGIMSAVTLGSMLLFYAMSRVVTLDVTVSAMITGALGCFWLGVQPVLNPRFPGEPLWNDNDQVTDLPQSWIPKCKWLFFVFMALAVLSKGLIGILIPGAIIVLWVIATKNWHALKLPFNPLGLLLFLAIAAPWHILVAQRNPEFLDFYFIQEHFLRYLTPMHSRVQPFWFFPAILLVGLFPLQGFLWGAMKRVFETKIKEVDLFLLIWSGFVLIFFSLSQSKLIPYILPALPPLALILGPYLVRVYYEQLPKDNLGTWVFLGFAFTIGIAFSCVTLGYIPEDIKERIAYHTKGLSPDSLRDIHSALSGTAFILIGGGLIIMMMIRQAKFKTIFNMILTTSVLAMLTINFGFSALAPRSAKELAEEIKKRAHPQDMVVSYKTYLQDLPVYLGRTISIVDWKGELEFGTTVEDTSQWMMTQEAFWEKVEITPQRIFLVATQEEGKRLLADKNHGKKLYPLVEKRDFILFSNQP